MKLSSRVFGMSIAAAIPFGVWLLGSVQSFAADCNSNGADDLLDISNGVSRDCNANAVPDECELADGSIVFEAKDAFATGLTTSVLAQDFDGDGDADLVVAEAEAPGWVEGDPETPSIVFLRNRGQGLFAAPVRYPMAPWSSVVSGDDLDGDGDPDLLLLLYSIGSVGTMLNHGDGTFEPVQSYAVGMAPVTSVQRLTADLDGDHDLDVVCSSDEGVAILLNRGDGTFEPRHLIGIDRAYYFEFADVDADGDVDIAVDTATSQQYSEPGTLVVLKNDGHGAFPERDVYELGKWLQQLAAADLDGDHRVDFVVTQSRPRLLAVLKNRGDGHLDLASPLDPHHVPGQNQPEHVTIADLDGDGDSDVLAAADGLYGTRENITLFLNQGGGVFADGVQLLAGDEPEHIDVRDLNGDGRPEILALNWFSGDLSVFKNLGGGAFAQGSQFPIAASGVDGMCLGDFDGDGDLDVAAARYNNEASLVIVENISGGAFTRGCNSFRRGDVNSDGEVSLADIISLRRYLFEGSLSLTCFDAADVTDNDRVSICDAVSILDALFRNPGWANTLPAPSPDAGEDPTPLGAPWQACDVNSYPQSGGHPLGCSSYQVVPPETTEDILRVGDAVGLPGEAAKIPIYLTSDVPVDAIQLVLSYDPNALEPATDEESEGISFEATYMERFQTPFGFLSAQPDQGVLLVGIAGDLIRPGFAIEPGDDILVGWINVRVKPEAAGDVSVEPTNGQDDLGVGTYRLRNEITHKGAARLVSVLPRTIGGRLGIVGDQSLFVRGDTNGDRKLDVSDPISTLRSLFQSAVGLKCEDASDANDDGTINISDAVFTLGYLFQGTRRPPPPFPNLGVDTTEDSLHCGAPAGER